MGGGGRVRVRGRVRVGDRGNPRTCTAARLALDAGIWTVVVSPVTLRVTSAGVRLRLARIWLGLGLGPGLGLGLGSALGLGLG